MVHAKQEKRKSTVFPELRFQKCKKKQEETSRKFRVTFNSKNTGKVPVRIAE